MGLPITLLAVGGGVSAVCGLLTQLVAGAEPPSRRYAWDEDGNRYTYRHVDPERRDGLRTFGTCSAVGLVAVGTGLGLLIARSKSRKRNAAEIRELRQRRDALQQGLSYSLSLEVRALGGSVGFSF